ncbi:MAG: helix-turn-helix transcriptional regulator [Lachnospiraceae bacterium]|jgi:transcriptional regulator with XRE-family HTH domain|nr:helix-turn-helix transcriptional regulator [Lachnospiraceae bacterium]
MDNCLLDLKGVGNRIRELRYSLDYTQEKFSSKVPISTSYLALLETGKRAASIDVLAQIANTYHVSIDYLLFGKEEPLQTKNDRLFQELSSHYSEQEMADALSLAEFYLKNLSDSGKKA